MQKKINILLIEDNPADSELIGIFLKGSYASRCSVVTADSLTKGVELLDKDAFDVIIADLSLPDSAGLETFNKVNEKAPHIPIIVLTGMEDESIGINAVKLGAQDFLIKGKIKGKELTRSINYSIERHKLLLELEEKARLLEEKTADLYSEKQKLSEAQKLAHIGSWEWNITENKINWSEEFYLIHGMEPKDEELPFEKLLSDLHPADRDHVRKVLEEVKNTHKPFTFYYRIIRPDGAVRTLHARAEAIMNKGEILKVVGTGQDVTERLQEEEMENLALAATKSFNSVLITDANGMIEWVNEGFTKLTGYALTEVKGTHGEKLRKGTRSDISQDKGFFKEVTIRKMPITYESKNLTKDGKEHWTITTLTPVLDKEGQVKRIIAIDSDITQRKQVEEDLVRANRIAEHSLMKGNKALNELIKAKKQLEESMKVKEQFLANMSHEIRTPMNAIVGFTDLLLKTPLAKDQKQYIDAIKVSGENLLVIINDILDFSKMQAGKIAFEKAEFRLSQVISITTELMLPKSVEKNTKLSTSVDKTIPDRLLGDPTRLTQILLNLTGNAIKFTKTGEIKIVVELANETSDDVELKFSVIDTGIGIPADKLPTIFDAFTQATSDTTRKYGGTGLGLAIVKQLVELQEGHLYVKSKVDVGSTFYFTLRFKKNLTQESTEKRPKEDDAVTESVEGLNVLLVEDNILNQVLAKKVLTDWHWNVDIADNGLKAVEKVQEKDFDIVLMDIQLPEMDGYEATKYIRNQLNPEKASVPIMAMTAHAISSEEEKCINAGMDGYISKPFNQKTLYSKIMSIVHPHNGHSNGHSKPPINETQNLQLMAEEHKHTDLSYLRQLSNGDNKFIGEMLNLFIEQTPDALNRMTKALEIKDWKTLGNAAHKMKPSIMFVGLKEIEADLRDLEHFASESSNIEQIPPLLDKVKTACLAAIEELKEEKLHLA
jgi:PAS domain S-box-containing protein